MKVLDLINANLENWQDLLRNKPYCISIQNDKDYWLLKYNMLESDLGLVEVQECRGSIVRFNRELEKYECVCYPFIKFFNYGEKFAATLDWNSAAVQEKIDGSLIKIWFDRGEWRISTNGTINAFKCDCGDSTFGSLFLKVLGKDNWESFVNNLAPYYTYMFELVVPQYNRIVVRYKEDSIYYLGRRDLRTEVEDNAELRFMEEFGIKRPMLYHLTNLNECIAAAHMLGEDKEGFVCCDKWFNRVKVKGDEYLRLHKLKQNGVITVENIIEMWQNESIDDFLAYYDEYEEFANNVLNSVKNEIDRMEMAWFNVKGMMNDWDRKDFALYANTYNGGIRGYLFTKLDNKVENAFMYCKNMRAKQLAKLLTFI